jgi:hypothetical protein
MAIPKRASARHWNLNWNLKFHMPSEKKPKKRRKLKCKPSKDEWLHNDLCIPFWNKFIDFIYAIF